MEYLDTIEELEGLYGTPGRAALSKVTDYLTPSYSKWIGRARFCLVSTIGPDGVDGSPRGDEAAVVRQLDTKTLALPDWSGNNRIDSLRNLLVDQRISLLFMVAGSTSVIRVNGCAKITADTEILAQFEKNSKQPRTVIIVKITEVYFQCARAVMRAGIWSDGDLSHGLPTAGQMLKDAADGDFDGDAYDKTWPERAKDTMW